MAQVPGKSADIVIVGAGIIGLAIAWALRQSGARVVVLDRQTPGQGASWAGGGILSPLPPDRRDPALEPLLQRSLALYPAWCAELAGHSGLDPEYWACGARYIVGERVQEFPGIAQVRNPRMLATLLAAVRGSGVEVRDPVEVNGWRVERGQLTGVMTSEGVLTCGCAVLAAGAWSAQIQPLPVRPIKGEMLLLRGAPGALERILIGADVYLIPRRDGHVLVGSTLEDAGFDTSTSAANRAHLLAEARKLWPAVDTLELQAHWAGLRPCADRGVPLMSEVPQIDGLYCCTGHFRVGLTLAPASAELMAALLCGRAPIVDPAPFRCG